MPVDDTRPDPDELLEKLQKDAEKERRGRLKIFFGGCAGVGKTFAMLAAGSAMRAQGVDVVVGIVETHGRRETEAQLAALEVLPRRLIEYRGRQLGEFDLDGALARKPSLVLVDELAHSNVPGSRHAKRWQDVEELRTAGIDVFTTLNVQHLESLNDVVGQITGIRVRETLPDHVFEQADEVTLVDLPPDELLQRLKEGKVYIPQQAERAGKNFFRKGNLIALRELALRRTADRVDAQMREYRADQAIHHVWEAKDRLLVCIGPDPEGDRLVRVSARLAASLKADLLAVYVETPALQKLSDAQREAILKTLRLAQEMGAETTTLSGTQVARVLLSYARSRNVSKLVIGKSRRSFLSRLTRRSVADDLTVHAEDVDVYVVGRGLGDSAKLPRRATGASMVSLEFETVPPSKSRRYLWAAASSAITTAIAAYLVRHFDLSNVIMLYLLGVVVVSVRYGRGPGILASFLGVAAFDFFFVPPRMSFTVSDTQYLFTFVVMLVVSLVIGNLTSGLRYQARIATYRERRTSALYDLGKELAAALMAPQIVEISTRYLSGVFQSKVAMLLPDSHEHVQPLAAGDAGPDTALAPVAIDTSVAQWVYDHQEKAGLGTNTLPAGQVLYLPLKAPMRTRGVLAIRPDHPDTLMLPEQQRLLDTFSSQIGLALERVHYVEVAQDALLTMESERLRNSLLSAISHDLRTPLTAIIGVASTLKEQILDRKTQLDLIDMVYDDAFRMNSLVTNLLDMAKLQSGEVQLNRQWQSLEEVTGSALRGVHRSLAGHHVEVGLPPDLPLLRFDATLIERVLSNLLDNACKYTPAGTRIHVFAEQQDGEVWVSVRDDGPGLPPGMEAQIFEKFTRGEQESAKAGVGLGLAICRAIVEAHRGRIWARNLPEGGALFTFSLPAGAPPPLLDAESGLSEHEG
nr:two-component system sensor histidine kinase KdpD [Pandoraea terrae]